MLLLIAIGTFIAVISAVLMVYYYHAGDKETIQHRMDRYVDTVTPDKEDEALSKEQLSFLKGLIRKLSRYFESPKLVGMVEDKLIQAALPIRSSEFIVIWLGTILISALLGFVFSGGLAALITGLLGGLVPHLYIRNKAAQRVKAFNDQLGDALVLIANALRTGYSFLQAVDLVSREALPPISVEFARALKEMNFGLSTEEALNNMAKRIKSDDLDLIITAVVIQRQVGGNLAEILDKISNTIRGRIRLKGQIRTLTAQGRVSGWVVGLIPLGLLLIIYSMNPSYMGTMFTHPVGKTAIMIAVMMQLLGVWIISRIVDIEC